jgi:hypothetical protein
VMGGALHPLGATAGRRVSWCDRRYRLLRLGVWRCPLLLLLFGSVRRRLLLGVQSRPHSTDGVVGQIDTGDVEGVASNEL